MAIPLSLFTFDTSKTDLGNVKLCGLICGYRSGGKALQRDPQNMPRKRGCDDVCPDLGPGVSGHNAVERRRTRSSSLKIDELRKCSGYQNGDSHITTDSSGLSSMDKPGEGQLNSNDCFKRTKPQSLPPALRKSPRKSLDSVNKSALNSVRIEVARSKDTFPPRRRQNNLQKSLRASPRKLKSPHKNNGGGLYGVLKEHETEIHISSPLSPQRRLNDPLCPKSKWNPRDPNQMHALKEALHVSMAPSSVVCRDEEQKRVFAFCKGCIEQEKAGSLYVCGCPGTGKTLSIGKVKEQLVAWSKDAGFHVPIAVTLNCASLVQTSAIFGKVVESYLPSKKYSSFTSPLHYLKESFSEQANFERMLLLIIDEIDYLITKDLSIMHELFMLTCLPFSRLVLIGIANAIDLADRFLPRLQSLNCKPLVVTFRAYSKDQILYILQQRLDNLLGAFHPQALELCCRRVAAASGDMRKVLNVCRNAIDFLEAELGESSVSSNEASCNQEFCLVRIDHMALALAKTFKSAIVDTIQTLPQHQQILLCSIVKLCNGKKKDTTIGELNKFYVDICKSEHISSINMLEFSNMCKVLSDQGLLKLGSSREDRTKRLMLKVDEADVTFALQGVRFFRNCLQ